MNRLIVKPIPQRTHTPKNWRWLAPAGRLAPTADSDAMKRRKLLINQIPWFG